MYFYFYFITHKKKINIIDCFTWSIKKLYHNTLPDMEC